MNLGLRHKTSKAINHRFMQIFAEGKALSAERLEIFAADLRLISQTLVSMPVGHVSASLTETLSVPIRG